ncbi:MULTISPECIES: FecR domain-containing protein [Pseudomonas]|uniref:FecR domain-containing protein n=1 Tax=Pseudomonas TaxID=286 RepID=UPI0004D79D64|nr:MULTISPECIES: FecR domain-containing protein [Pseudomonas]KES21198.1 iron dicitrate transport regulator FecR [Pseudomonas sp. AAC]MBH3433824.1 FecR domain-containing protein [Pseudomonas citronellolis]OHS14271.1 iron dicitrate transport regulator FecR [Pseudomonas sp. HMSC75E02]
MHEQTLDPRILGEAADWLVRLGERPASAADLRAIEQSIEQWRGRSAQHAEAWRRAESLLGGLQQLPPGMGRQSLQRLGERGLSRRQMLNRLSLLLAVAPAAWLGARQLPWAEWSADQRTATGERKRVQLPDGSLLTLNTGSAVDIRFSPRERRLRLLDGEILVATHADPAPEPRPFLVESRQGLLRTAGARFAVRDLGEACRVAVLEGSVAVEPFATAVRRQVEAGQQLLFSAGTLQAVQPADANASSWENGMLLAQDMRLDALLAELGRYRNGVLRCAPQLAGLRVSGAIPLGNDDAGLRLLADMLPLKVSSLTRYWVTLEPA